MIGNVAKVLLPASSLQLPTGSALLMKGPLYVVEVQESMPESESVPTKSIRTGRLYQPS